MADLKGTYRFCDSPVIDYTVAYRTTRTAVDTVKTTVTVQISKIASPYYYGYNITGYIKINGAKGATQTIKNNSPSTWNAFTFTFPTITTTGVAATATSFSAVVYLSTNAGFSENTGSRTVSFPVGNTAPYWSGGNIQSNCAYSKGSVVPENATTLSFRWSGAKDDQNNPIKYVADVYANGTKVTNIASDTTVSSASWSAFSSVAEGASIALRVYCKDDGTAYGSNYIQQTVFTKNKMTPARLSANSSAINFDTTGFSLTRTEASNLNGNSVFYYTLKSPDIHLYNNLLSTTEKTIPVTIYRSGAIPSGPYIKFSELKNCVALTSYQGTLRIYLETENNYGTVKSSDNLTFFVDLQKEPSVPTQLAATGNYTIQGNNYYIINQKAIEFSWAACSEPNGTSVTYDVETNLDGSGWNRAVTGKTDTKYTFESVIRSTKGSLKLRVRCKTGYGTVSPWAESDLLTLDYYYPPVIGSLTVDRGDNSQTTNGEVKARSSMQDLVYSVTVTYKRDNATLATQTIDMKSAQKIQYVQSGLSEADTFTETVTISENISAANFDYVDPKSTATVIVPRYAAMLTIREKGIGVHAIAGNNADFIVKGTTSLFGGDMEGGKTGNLDLGTQTSAFTNVYSGLYLDSEGCLRAAQDIAANSNVYQTQIYHVASLNAPPIRWKTLSSNLKTDKDAIFTPSTSSGWHNLLDTDMNGVDYNTLANSLKQFLSPASHTHNAGDIGIGATPEEMANARNSFGMYQILKSNISWSSGPMNVPNSRYYNMFQIKYSGDTTVLAIKINNVIRGIGGLGDGGNRQYIFHFAATFSGDDWTLVSAGCIRHDGSSSHQAMSKETIVKIVGLF